MLSFKKFFVSTLVLTALATVTTVPSFAATEKSVAPTGGPRIVHHVHTLQSTVTSPIVLQKNGTSSGGDAPNLSSTTTDGNGGSATITLLDSDTSFAWSIVPSWIGPYDYSVYVVIEKQTGAYVAQSAFNGLSIGGTHSDVTGSYAYLPVGSYFAILEGTCTYDFGEATIMNPTIPFYID